MYRLLLPMRKEDPQSDLVTLASHLLPVPPTPPSERGAVAATRDGVPAAGGVIELMGMVPVPEDRSLSEGALPAQEIRDQLMALARAFPDVSLRVKPRVRVSRIPWLTVMEELRDDPVDLVLLPLDSSGKTVLGAPLAEVLSRVPCDLVIARGMVHRYDRVLLPIRGGPHIGLMLRLASALYQIAKEEVTLLAVTREGAQPPWLARLAERAPFKSQVIHEVGDPVRVIRNASTRHHALILGATLPKSKRSGVGRVPAELLSQTPLPVFLVRSFHPGGTSIAEAVAPSSASVEASPLSERVDRWFATNTFHWTEFQDVGQLVRWKEEQNQKISLVLPALNEEATIGQVITSVKVPLQEEHPLLDEIILMDSNSTDRTREVAADLGVPVYIHQQVLADQVKSLPGKGEALWKSLYVARGDIIVWIDTDIVNIHPRFVIGTLGPLLRWNRIQYVKGFYQRPLSTRDRVRVSGGGRVTELLARPFINLFFPELSGIVQPLSGEYAGRRCALEQLPFFAGYGVEAGLLVDLLRRYGLRGIAQCNLEMRTHRSQSLSSLSKMAFAILQVFSSRLETVDHARLLEEAQRTMKTILYEPGHFCLQEAEISEHERPPMVTVPAYCARFRCDADARRAGHRE
jgi:nucleotide-binding universal stress UspA family protein